MVSNLMQAGAGLVPHVWALRQQASGILQQLQQPMHGLEPSEEASFRDSLHQRLNDLYYQIKTYRPPGWGDKGPDEGLSAFPAFGQQPGGISQDLQRMSGPRYGLPSAPDPFEALRPYLMARSTVPLGGTNRPLIAVPPGTSVYHGPIKIRNVADERPVSPPSVGVSSVQALGLDTKAPVSRYGSGMDDGRMAAYNAWVNGQPPPQQPQPDPYLRAGLPFTKADFQYSIDHGLSLVRTGDGSGPGLSKDRAMQDVTRVTGQTAFPASMTQEQLEQEQEDRANPFTGIRANPDRSLTTGQIADRWIDRARETPQMLGELANSVLGIDPSRHPYLGKAGNFVGGVLGSPVGVTGSALKSAQDPIGAWHHAPEGVSDLLDSVNAFGPLLYPKLVQSAGYDTSGPGQFGRMLDLGAGSYGSSRVIDALRGGRPDGTVHLDSALVLKTGTRAEWRQSLRQYAQSNFQNQAVEVPNLGPVKITATGIRHTASRAVSNEAAAALMRLPDVLRRGAYVGSAMDEGNPNVFAWHYLVTPITMDGIRYSVLSRIREDGNGNLFYHLDDQFPRRPP